MRHEVVTLSGAGSIRSAVVLAGLALAGACGGSAMNSEPPPDNRPPLLTVKNVTTDEGVAVTVDLLDGVTDPEGDPLTVTNAFSTGHVVQLQDGRSVTVTPAPGFFGVLVVSYVVSDTHNTIDGAVRVTVRRTDDRPTAKSFELTVKNDQLVGLGLGGSDPLDRPLTFQIVHGPSNGTLLGEPPFPTYRPNANFVGDDQVLYTASNVEKTSEPATITLHVVGPNQAPVAGDQTVAATEDAITDITLTGSDPDGDPLSFNIDGGPSHGVLNLVGPGPHWTYQPFSNYHGPDSFTFFVRDGQVASGDATVTIDVASVNDPPTVSALTRFLNEDTPATIALQGSDIDGDPLTFAVADGPHHGSVTISASTATYTPDRDYNGSDSFTYTAFDGTATSAPATISLFVSPVNDAPVAIDGSVTTVEETPVNLTLQATDVEGQPLTYSIVSQPSDGTLSSGSGPNRTYTPARNATGVRSFTFRASDGVATGNIATFTITITPVNDPPTAVDDWVATDPATPLTIDVLSNDPDVDGDALTITSVDAPAHGSIEIVDNKLLYTPDDGFTGVDVFGYSLADPSNLSASATVHVGVGGFPVGAPTEIIVPLATDSSDPRRSPSLSSDGRLVAFTTPRALIADDTNQVHDIYVYDRGTRTFSRVSVSSSGEQANSDSTNPRITPDGRYVVFESTATNLVPGDSNARTDVFRHDRVTGETVRVSVATGGAQATGLSIDPRISDDGNRVVFSSAAFDLVSNDANGAPDIFVRDIAAGTTTRVSVSTTGGDADLPSTEPAISGDGRFVAFSSAATNLVAGDGNTVRDIFVRDLAAGTTVRVSVATTGGEANQASSGASLSRDGRFVSFLSSATNLVAGVTGTTVYVRDTQASTTTHPPVTTGMAWAQLSSDGRYVATYSPFTGISICDRIAANTVVPAGGSGWAFPVFSASGRYVAAIVSAGGGSLVIAPNPL